MTSIEPLLVVPSFRASLEVILQRSQEIGDSLRRGIGIEDVAQLEEDRVAHIGLSTRRAFSILYDTASNESAAAVVSDIKSAFPTATKQQLERLAAILEPDPLLTERLDGTRQRDSVLPILASARLVLDLRAIETQGGNTFVPVVTARFSFDEHVGGNDSVIFQVPWGGLSEIAQQINSIRQAAIALGTGPTTIDIPEWSKEIDE